MNNPNGAVLSRLEIGLSTRFSRHSAYRYLGGGNISNSARSTLNPLCRKTSATQSRKSHWVGRGGSLAKLGAGAPTGRGPEGRGKGDGETPVSKAKGSSSKQWDPESLPRH